MIHRRIKPSPKPAAASAGGPGEGVRSLTVCPQCGCPDLFVRKNFPQKLGLAVVVLSALAFLILAARPGTLYIGAWILTAAAALDAVLYFFVGRLTVCYRCRAEFRGPINPRHGGFDLATAEKYRAP